MNDEWTNENERMHFKNIEVYSRLSLSETSNNIEAKGCEQKHARTVFLGGEVCDDYGR